MEQRSGTVIFPNRVTLDQSYIDEKGGILNALTYASAQYIYKVLEKHGRDNIKWFDSSKSKKLRRTIIHKNAHLDEYFAELIFRAILPPHLKDIEVCEHVLMSKEDDTYAKISWPNGVVFGIHADEAGGAKALAFYDEHHADGSRTIASCSQLVAQEYLGNNVPASINKVLAEVNYSDSHSGSHPMHLKNLITAIHDTLYTVGTNEINNNPITKYLTENWKRSIINACLTAMIYVYENALLPSTIDDRIKEQMESITKKSLDYFINKSLLRSIDASHFEDVAGDFRFKFKVWNQTNRSDKNWHKTINEAVWRNENDGGIIGNQILTIHYVAYALDKCWGNNIASFVMMHLWQVLFQQQISFLAVKNQLMDNFKVSSEFDTLFGSIKKIELQNLKFKPETGVKERKARVFKENSDFWIFDVSITNPSYPNVSAVMNSIINSNYDQKGNNGFGIFLLKDKTINSLRINMGPSIPYRIRVKISDLITSSEPDKWFQLKNTEGIYEVFLLNRTKAHQDLLPSDKIDANYIVQTVLSIN